MSTALSNKKKYLVVGVTMGDPSGIGPEIIAKAINKLAISQKIKFLLIGDRFIFSKFLKHLPKNCQILDLNNVPKKNFCFGKKNRIYGKASFEYLELATSLIKAKEIDSLVTAPISKEAISLAGFKWPGHTEYLAQAFKVKQFAMMFVADKLKVSLVTRHIPLRKVSQSLNVDKIYQTVCLSHEWLSKYFRIKNPKIAVCALNPHAGEEGILGGEEGLIIKPAVKRAQMKFKNIFGPFPSDTVFLARNKFDCIVAMYHDQALIPLKTLFPNRAVNLTIGLPFVRTSPCHGTAFDIAGKNLANPTSMIEAIKLAVKLS
jgi:4-hydroxythreonine-4-phosphate dehydrogenase